jgi:hypothetical protein
MWFSRFWRPKFVHPISSGLRAVVLVPLFRDGRKTAYRSKNEAARQTRRKPQILAGYLAQLLACGAEPTHAVAVLTHPGQALYAADRDRLWNRFGVPIFQQIVDRRGGLIALECEAHGALHVADEPSALELGAIREDICPCGKQGLLLEPDDRQRALRVTRSEAVSPSAPIAST